MSVYDTYIKEVFKILKENRVKTFLERLVMLGDRARYQWQADSIQNSLNNYINQNFSSMETKIDKDKIVIILKRLK